MQPTIHIFRRSLFIVDQLVLFVIFFVSLYFIVGSIVFIKKKIKFTLLIDAHSAVGGVSRILTRKP